MGFVGEIQPREQGIETAGGESALEKQLLSNRGSLDCVGAAHQLRSGRRFLLSAFVVSRPCDKKKSQGRGTGGWRLAGYFWAVRSGFAFEGAGGLTFALR